MISAWFRMVRIYKQDEVRGKTTEVFDFEVNDHEFRLKEIQLALIMGTTMQE